MAEQLETKKRLLKSVMELTLQGKLQWRRVAVGAYEAEGERFRYLATYGVHRSVHKKMLEAATLHVIDQNGREVVTIAPDAQDVDEQGFELLVRLWQLVRASPASLEQVLQELEELAKR